MRIVAYLYTDPLLESKPDPAEWGWQIDRVYHDQADRQTVDRAQWQQLLQDAQNDPIDYLLVRQLEDLGASLEEVGDRLAELEARNIPLILLHTSPHPTPHTPHPTSNIRADLVNLLHQLQFNQRSRRIRQGHAQNRVKALPPPGKAPYGYRRGRNGYVLDRTTAPLVKEFFEQFLLYGSLRGAVRYLAKKYGKKIAVSTGQRWLTNPVYRGDLEYLDGQVVPDTHTAILSREEAAQIDRLLRRNRRMPPRTASAPRSLAGLVTCAECQSPLVVAKVSSRSRQEYLYLRPARCPQKPKCKAIAYDAILQEAIQRICVDLPQAVAELSLPDMDGIKGGIQGAIAGKQAILEQLPELVRSGVLDQDTADLRAYRVRTEIAELQSKLAQLPPVNLKSIAQTVALPQFWLDLSESERRFYFREFIQQIELVRQDQDWQLRLVFIF